MAAEAFDQKLKNQIKYLKLNCIEFVGFEYHRFSPTVSPTGTCSHFYDFDHDGNTEAQEPDIHSTGLRHHLSTRFLDAPDRVAIQTLHQPLIR